MTTLNLPVHFRTLEGGIVTFNRESGSTYAGHCEPCGDYWSGGLRTTRTWANTHAGQCRAIPKAVAAT